MDYAEIVENLNEMLTKYGEKIPYGEMVGAPFPYNKSGDLVWEDPEPYFIEKAATAITELIDRAEKAETERDDALELLHSYRHICRDLTPEHLEQIVNQAEWVDFMVYDMYMLLLAVDAGVRKKDLSLFRHPGAGAPENQIPFKRRFSKIEADYEELLYASCSAVERKKASQKKDGGCNHGKV